MSGRRTFAVLMSLAMLVSLLVSAPAVAQEVEEPDDVDYTSSELFEKTLLEDDIGEPMTIDVDESGRIFMTDRRGTLRIHDQETGETTVAAVIDTYTEHYPLGSNEGGLLGATLDPDFEDNQWIYVYYSDPDPDAWHVNLSRFEVDGDVLDMDSEIVMLEVESQRLNCCHMGGQIKFDAAGDLYLSIGDETSPFESDQYAPIDTREGRETFDALRTAGNTADLRGSILRITPEADGTYSIPEGNLFPEGEYDAAEARPEIYVMGARNPFRIAIDEETGWLYYGMYGPAATQWNDQRGPMGFDQFHQVREASNQGWPYCTGDLYAYTPWDFDANAPIEGAEPFDCENGPTNHSPNNTGLEQVPPVDPAFIYYPTSWNNYPFDVPEHFDNLGSGAGGPNGGPIYRYDEDLDSDTKFPEHFDGHWFILDWHRNWVKTVELGDDGEIDGIHDFMADTAFMAPHDALFGPDGSLYVLEYGGGYFNEANNNGLYRIDYVGEGDGGEEPPPEPGECVEETIDDFDGDDLDRDTWSRIVREDPDGYSVGDGVLTLQTAVGDMIREYTDAPNLILQPVPEGAWQATTEMTLDPSDPWQQAGLIVYGDDDNFIKAPLAYGGTDRHLEFILQSNGQARATGSDWIVVPSDVPDTIQLRLTSDGSEVVGEYSVDGETWSGFGRPASLAGIDDPHVGFFAARGPDEGPVTEAAYDWFSLAVGQDARGPNDDFEGDELDRCIWPRIVREDPDGYAVSDGSLILPTAVGDMIRTTTTSPNLILQPLPNAPWQATTEMTLDPSDPWQQAGLIVYDDDGNFIKAPLAYGGDGQRRLEFLLHVDGEARATDADWAVVPQDTPTTIQLRLTSDGAMVRAEYSADDGETWTGFGRPASLGNMDDPYVGFFAARGPDEGPVTDAAFHWFTLDREVDAGPECGEPVIEDGYRALWDGATLDGWNMAGPGMFDIVEDVDRDGTCALETIDGMGLLWHEEEFESYRVRMDFKALAEDDNSGVFIGFPDPGDDPWIAVNQGYEIQIDDTGGSPGAGPEARTGSIYTFQGPTAYPTVAGEWNTLEIEVDDPMIRVWINDELVNEYESDGTGRDLSSGHIGLQNNRPSDNVFFRDIQVTELIDELECGEPVLEEGYRALWDGATLDGWNQAGPGGFDVVEDVDREGTCALESIGDPEGLGMLWHDDELESYRLRTDFKAAAEDDNSGVFFGFPDPGDDPWVGVNQGYEINIDDTGGFPGAGPEHMTGSIYTFQGPTSFPTVAGEWNTMEIEVDDPMVRVWINDVLVNEYESEGTGRDLSSGFIGLQNNRVSDTVFFRDVQVLELEEPDPTVEASLDPSEPDGDAGWYRSPVTLSLTSDPLEAQLRWRLTGDDAWTSYEEPVTFDADGEYAVEYQATVGDDEPHEPGEFDVAVGRGGAWTFDPDEFTVTEGDTIVYELLDGFHNVVTVDEDGNQVATSGPPSTDWDTYEFTADEKGTFYIYCAPHAGTAVDDPADYTGMVGRFEVEPAPQPQRASEIGEVSFQLDQTAPATEAALSGEQDGDVYTDDVTVTLDATDATSGVAETHHRMLGDDGYEVYDAPFVVSDEGDHTVEFRSVDVAGNVEDWQQISFTISTEEEPEPPTQPTTKDDCKNGGWQTFTDPSFRNQGQCVSWVATGAGGGGPGNSGNAPGRG